MKYSNAQILSAVFTHWTEPVVSTLGTSKIHAILTNMPMMGVADNWLAKWGLVPQGYSLAAELTELSDGLTSAVVNELLTAQLSKVSDDAIPRMAHKMADKWVEKGGLEVLGGNVKFTAEDVAELKMLLDKNLPLSEEVAGYQVII